MTKYNPHYTTKTFGTHDQVPTIFKDPSPIEQDKRAEDLDKSIQEAKDKINE